MEFRFNVNEIFKQPIVEINSSLIPPGLSLADKRALWDAVGKVSDVVNAMGEASASAQGLTKPITTSERLRNSEHKLYLLIDQNANNGKGVVTGMLKTGKKGLYVFDRDGHHYQVQPACVLDFYVHESKQRMGLGRKLFEHMLEKEQVEPVKMAIDRPSDKFLGFLNKHYTLDNPVKQMNNFVVFDGFFPETKDELAENNNTPLGKSSQPANGLQSNYASPYGRYGAPRPPCSMGQIIHNQSPLVQQSQEPVGTSLNIRSPAKNRSIYSDKHQTDSVGSQQFSQRATSNTWNSNQNSPSNQQFQNYQQSPDDYNMNVDNQQTSSNIQMMNAQSQQQAYNMYNQTNNQNSQYHYNQNQYGVEQNAQQPHQQNQANAYQNQQLQNQYASNIVENTQQQFAQQQQQYVSDKTQNAQVMRQPLQDGDVQPQQKKSVQFVPDQLRTQSLAYNQQTQPQSTYEQKSVETMQENRIKPVPNITYQQSGQAAPNVNAKQYTEDANMVDNSQGYQAQQNNHRYNLTQYAQQPTQNIQQQQNSSQMLEAMYQYQQPQSPHQSEHTVHQSLHPQQDTYQQQQVQFATYPAQQTQQNTFQPHHAQPQQTTNQHQQEGLQYYQAPQTMYQMSQPTYQSQYSQQGSPTVYQTPQPTYQPQYQQQSPMVLDQQQQERFQPRQASQVVNQTSQPILQPQHAALQKQQSSQTTQSIKQNDQVLQKQYPGNITDQQQYDQNNNVQGQRQNVPGYQNRDGMISASHSSTSPLNNYQNVQNPVNYQMNQQQNLSEQQTRPTQNISNHQMSLNSARNLVTSNHMIQSQHTIPVSQQVYPQIQHQVDPSAIVPPMEAGNNQTQKNYQYYDSSTGRMQRVSEKANYLPEAGAGIPPNASGSQIYSQ